MSAMASCESEAYCEYGKLLRTYSKNRVASNGFWSFFSCIPFSYALAALLASGAVAGFVMSTPASLPEAQAQSAQRRSALAVVDAIVTFPLDPQRLRGRRRPVALRDQPPQEALLLPLIGGLPSLELPPQRLGCELLFRRALGRLRSRAARLGLVDPLRRKLPRSEARSVPQPDPRAGTNPGGLRVVDVAQLSQPRQR